MSDPVLISDQLADARRSLIHAAPSELTNDEIVVAQAEGMSALAEMRWSAAIPQRFVKASFAGVLDAAARSEIEAWAAHTRPPNLVLLGPIGAGKTSAAVAAVRPSFEASRDVMFAPVHELLDQLRVGHDEERRWLDDFCHVDRLILDDLGAERQSEWTSERLALVVNRRWVDERPMVVTSNLNRDDLSMRLGPHTASRLFGSGAAVVVIKGKDRRQG